MLYSKQLCDPVPGTPVTNHFRLVYKSWYEPGCHGSTGTRPGRNDGLGVQPGNVLPGSGAHSGRGTSACHRGPGGQDGCSRDTRSGTTCVDCSAPSDDDLTSRHLGRNFGTRSTWCKCSRCLWYPVATATRRTTLQGSSTTTWACTGAGTWYYGFFNEHFGSTEPSRDDIRTIRHSTSGSCTGGCTGARSQPGSLGTVATEEKSLVRLVLGLELMELAAGT